MSDKRHDNKPKPAEAPEADLDADLIEAEQLERAGTPSPERQGGAKGSHGQGASQKQ